MAAVNSALAVQRAEQATVVELRIQGLTLREIADQLNTSDTRVSVILNDALKAENGDGPLTDAAAQRTELKAQTEAKTVELRMQGLTSPEIAKQVDLTGSRVRMILHKARKAEGATGPLTEIAAREADRRARRATDAMCQVK